MPLGEGRSRVDVGEVTSAILVEPGLEPMAWRKRDVGPDELNVHYQPVFRPATGEIHAFEVVADPSDGLADRVLEAVCHQAATWERAGIRPHLNLAVSPTQLRRTGFADSLGDYVSRALLDPSWFTVEIVESAATAGDDEVRAVLGRLHDVGFRIALDGFDADYSSLARLRDLPVDELKVRFAGALDMESLAEGVESQEQLDSLVARQCGLARGFRRAEPLTPEQATLLLRRTPREAPVVVEGR